MGIGVHLISFIMVFLCSSCGNSCTTKERGGIFHQSASNQMRCSMSHLLQFLDFYCRKQKWQPLFIPSSASGKSPAPREAAESKFKMLPRSCGGDFLFLTGWPVSSSAGDFRSQSQQCLDVMILWRREPKLTVLLYSFLHSWIFTSLLLAPWPPQRW